MPEFTEEMLKSLGEKAVNFGIDIIIALIILFIGKKVIKLLNKLVKKIFDKVNIDLGVEKFLMSLINLALYAILIIMIAKQIGFDTASLITVIGSAGLAIGLALQGSLSNFAGGVLILVLKPFHVGDYIIDSGTGLEGVVEDIDIFYTKLATGDNKSVCIPNGALSNSGITNVSAKGERRLDFTVGIGYTSDIKLAKQLVTEIISKREKVLQNKGITVFVGNLGESSVDIGFRCWVNGSDYWSEKWAILEEVKLAFDANGIEIPFNQLDVHMKNS